MLKKIIVRPILATVISLIIVLLGVVGLLMLPITRFPEIAPPSVAVSASYSGADAQTIAKSVLLPLEEDINGVEDMTYMKSDASSGSGTINVYFKQGTDPNQAAVNVQTRTSSALSDLPAEVVTSGISVSPRQTGVIMTINVFSVDPALDETFLHVYSNREIRRELSRINGVASISILGYRNIAMRIWLNPNKLKAYNLVPMDIKKAIESQNFEIAPGEFGQNSNKTFETVIKYTGRFHSKEEFQDIVIKTKDDGSILHLKDVARVELGPTNTHNENRVNGLPGLTMNVKQTSGSNARDIDIAIRKKLGELSSKFPNGIKYKVSYSIKNQIDESINQVVHTLIEAFVLVFIIVFIFLQNLRATIIPAIAVPVSLIGTFFVMYLLGFSINMLTLFALVLSIGIVVDDAIVVVEAIQHKLDHTKSRGKTAVIETMGEITPAILSITMIMAAVFLPIGFMQGPSGVFYRQFAYTLIAAILISAINALTLSPALSAILLKPSEKEQLSGDLPAKIDNKKAYYKAKRKGLLQRFFTAFNVSFELMTKKYLSSIKYLIHNRKIALIGFSVITAIGFLIMSFTPTAFIPNEDDGFIIYSLKLPPGSSLARTTTVLDEVVTILKDRPEIMSMSSSAGYNGVDGTNSTSYAVGYINMYPHNKREGIKDIRMFMDTLRKELSVVNGVDITVFKRPTVTGFGEQEGIQFVLEDQLGTDFQTFGSVADSFIKVLNERPEILKASTSFEANFPQYEIDVNNEKAKLLGVNPKEMLQNFRMYYSRVRVSEFNLFNRQNRVYVQAYPEYTASPSSFFSIYVRNDKGEMVPVNTVANLNKTYGPEIVTRYNLYNSIEMNTIPAEGYSTGEVMDIIKEIATKQLPDNYKYEWTGMSAQEAKAGNQTIFILILSILFVYLLLSAQYESYILPFSILISILSGVIGVFGMLFLFGIDNNIYVQVGLIMLIGLLAKNAILIVEYSEQYVKQGHSYFKAAIEGAKLRLRPILMTSLAFVAGLIPLMWTSGSSAQGNHSISIGTAGGMVSGVVIGVFIVPVLFVVFKKMDAKVKHKKLKSL